jgi:hypothetical protein
MYCPECRGEYRSGFTRCNDCNVPLVETLPADTGADEDVAGSGYFCPSCAQPVSLTSRECPWCGLALASPPEESAPALRAEADNATVATHCPDCGRAADADAQFCKHCGCSFRSAAPERVVDDQLGAAVRNNVIAIAVLVVGAVVVYAIHHRNPSSLSENQASASPTASPPPAPSYQPSSQPVGTASGQLSNQAVEVAVGQVINRYRVGGSFKVVGTRKTGQSSYVADLQFSGFQYPIGGFPERPQDSSTWPKKSYDNALRDHPGAPPNPAETVDLITYNGRGIAAIVEYTDGRRVLKSVQVGGMHGFTVNSDIAMK